MFFVSSRASAPLRHFQDDPRSMRLASEFRKLVAAARNYTSSRPRLIALGEDPVIEHLVSMAGFGELDVHVQRTSAGQRMVTVICVPTRIWHNEEGRRRLLEIKREAKELRTSCILVPQRWLRAPVRSSVARVLAGARNTSYSRCHVGLVLEYLRKARISSLAETASEMREHDDPVGVILAMACHGLLEFDRSRPISSDTYVAASSWTPHPVTNGGER